MNASARPNYTIRPGDPLSAGVRALIAELDAFNSALYPAESNHFDPPEALAGPGCVFLVVEQRGELVGCGAAKNCGGWAELKRMTSDTDSLAPAYNRALERARNSRGHKFAGNHPILTPARAAEYAQVLVSFARR